MSKKKKKDTWQDFSDGFFKLMEEDVAPVSTKKESKKDIAPVYVNKTAPLFNDIAPMVTTTKKKDDDGGLDFFQKGSFSDGYQFGDVTKAILGTTADTGVGIVKGASKLVGGVLDAGAYGIAGVADVLGKDKYADDLRKKAQKNVIDDAFEGTDSFLNKYSVLGRTSDAIAEGVGQVGSIILTGGIAGALGAGAGVATAAPTGLMGVSSIGSGMSEAYAGGATDEEAATYGLIKGVVEAGSEMIFGGLGKTVKAVGLSKGLSSLDYVFAQKLSSKIANQTAKNFIQYGVKASAEGVEEVLAGAGTIAAKKLTYMDDAELNDLLRDENLLEQFVVGAVTSGIAQSGIVPGMKSGSLKEANETGRDFISGMSQNEQKVVDKEYQTRLAEAEENGKLTKKQQNELYDEVLRDMERGYISTDTIEEVLGGETYKGYRNTVDYEDGLKSEFDQLNRMKQGEMTGEQVDRRNELKAQLEELKTKSQRKQMQTALRDEVMGMVKGDRLAESYNEQYRRGQAFEADLTKYNEKQQATVQKAIDSGILNNSNRTHEFVDMVAKISADKGVPFDFTNNEKLKESGFAVEDKTVNGLLTKDGIALNIQSAKALDTVVGHEITHVLEGTELYDTLKVAVADYAKTKGDYHHRYAAISKLYEGQDADIEAELTADLIGDYLFTDADFVNNLSVNHRNVFQKIYDEIKYLCKVVTAGSKEARQLEKVKHAFDQAYKASGKQQSDTKYSISDSDGKQLTQEQAEYFKDSKVRDENGNLKVMYHGASRGGYTIPDPYGKTRYGLFGAGIYFTDNKEVAESYTAKGRGNTPQVYEVYLNIKNPIDMDAAADAEAWKKAFPDADYPESGTNEQFYRAMEQFFRDDDWTAGDAKETAWEVIEAMGYDGVTHIGGGRFNKKDDTRHRVYIAFLPEQIKNIDNAKPTGDPDIRFSLSRNDELMRNAEDYNNSHLSINLESARQQRQEIYDFMIANMDRLKLPEDIEGNTAIKNSSYDITEENTTVCIRSMAADALCDAVAENLGRPLTVQETLLVSQDLMNYTDEPECVYCYVATDRRAYREFLGSYHKQMRDAIKDIQSGKNLDEVYQEFLNGRKDTKNMRNRFAMWERIANGGKMISAKDLASEKMMQNAMRDPELAAQVKDARAYAQSASWAKKRQGYQAYDGHIMKWSQRRVNDLNKHYGLRFYSFSDFSPAFVLENMQQMTDAAARGLKGLAYTKVLDFAEIFAPTGANINISVFGYDQNGTVAQDGMMGAGWKGAQDLRNRYENVGITFVATNDSQIEWALDQDWIDVVIPYHLVRTGQAVAKHFGYVNYTAESGDTKGANWKKGDKKTIYPSEHNNDKQTYLNALAEANLEPRFARWVNHPNYMKLVNETRRAANETPALRAEFNVDAAKASLQNMMNRGGYFVPIGGDYANMQDIASEIADDIRNRPQHSLSNEGETVAPTGGRFYGRDMMLQKPDAETAPVQETEMFPDDLAPMSEDEAATHERLESIGDADAPTETEPYYGEENAPPAPRNPFEGRDYKTVGKQNVKAYMNENPEVKPFFQMQAEAMLGDLRASVKGERWYNDQVYYESGGAYGWSGTQRHTTDDIAYLLDSGYTYEQIENGLNAIIKGNGAENIAIAKKIEFALNDQLMNGYTDINGVEIPANQYYLNALTKMQTAETVGNQIPTHTDADAPAEIAPVMQQPKPQARPATKAESKSEPAPRVAKVLTEEPDVPSRKRNMLTKAMTNFADKGWVFENLAKKTKNRELEGKYNFMHYSEGRAQEYIKDNLMPLVERAEASGKTKQLYDYVYHLHNIDRMSLDTPENAAKRAAAMQHLEGLSEEQINSLSMRWITKDTSDETRTRIEAARAYIEANQTKNKPVFGDEVTAEASRKTVKQLEKMYPEFVPLGNAIVQYNNQLREMLVEGNIISRETADLWAKMYPHYVPIRRAGHEGASVSVPLDTNKTGVNAPIKRATGGNSDILPLFDTMAMRTEQTFKAIARNSFGVELMHTLDSVVESQDIGVDEAMDSMSGDTELLQAGKKGQKPTFTVFEDGKRVTFEINEDMYDALKPTNDALAYTNKIANGANSLFRGLLTEYNPVFMFTNMVKDAQDVLINSQHPVKTYARIPQAIAQIAGNGHWNTEYMENGGEQNTYFDSDSKTFTEADEGIKQILGQPLRTIAAANNFIERIPRLAEYIASREAGKSIEVSMLDAARVTTNFAAGGDVTKFLNRNGATFLNASVQGAMQQVRNIREAKMNGLKGYLCLATKFALAGLPAVILNNLVWDDDDEYEELSDYVKQNYYVVAKFGDGQFVRIPKGRTVAVIQEGLTQMQNLITGDDEADFGSFMELLIGNLAPNNPIDNNLLAPVMQVMNNKTWYGEDLVPTRLQDLPAAEQYDESTDALSKWLGEKINVSPYKLNYLLNQYSGGAGDVLLPMMTPEAERGDNSILGNFIAPFKDKFTTDGVLNNQNISDFYDAKQEMTTNAKSSKATDDDVLKNKYLNAVNDEISELYKQKREVQNSNLSDAEKYEQVRDIQSQIVELTRNALDSYENIERDGDYAKIGDVYFEWYTPESGESYWRKLTDEQKTKHLVTSAAGDAPYATNGEVHYRRGEDGKWTKISDRQLERQKEVTKALGITPEEYWSETEISFMPMTDGEYEYAYENPETYAVSKVVGGYDAFSSYKDAISDLKADKDANGKTISGSKKSKVTDYINSLDELDYGQKIILYRSQYDSKADKAAYDDDIVEYLNGRDDLSYEDRIAILKKLGFTISEDGETVSW